MGTLLRSGRPAPGRGPAAWRPRAARSSPRTRSRPRWATCSGCRTTSPAAWSRPWRCRWAAGEASPTPDAPHNARAYELYLRANELARTLRAAHGGARPLPAVPGAGPRLRPRLGPPRPLPPRDRQVHRGLAGQRRPRRGGLPPRPRARPAPLRGPPVLRAARGRHGPDAGRRSCGCSARPDATATTPSCSRGSCTSAATVGLYEQSIAAHEEARRLDPNVSTSYEQTLLLKGDIDAPPDRARDAPSAAEGDEGIRVIGLGLAGPSRRGAAGARPAGRPAHPGLRAVEGLPRGLARRPARRTWSPAMSSLGGADDHGRPRGHLPDGLAALRRRASTSGASTTSARAVAKGYFVAPTLAGRPAVRRAARRSRLPGAARARRKPAAHGRWPRSARPAESGSSAADRPDAGSEDPGPSARQGGDPAPAAHRAPGQRPPLRDGCPRTRWSAT